MGKLWLGLLVTLAGWLCPLYAQSLQDADQTALIGSTLMVGFHGKSPNHRGVSALCSRLSTGQVGGVIFYGRNIEDLEQTKALVSHLKRCGGYYQPIVAVDQEGGFVDRLGFGRFPNSRQRFTAAAYAANPAAYMEHYHRMLDAVARAGFDVNFAPVADLNINPDNPIVGKLGRAYSDQPRQALDAIALMLRAHMARQLATTLKHFPGHGSSKTDSHLGFTDISDTWTEAELTPFTIALEPAQFPTTGIMVGHLVHTVLDSTGTPSSLSKPIVDAMLRQQMGFQGPIISDDMHMRAISRYYGWADAAKGALIAGIDMVIQSDGSPGNIDAYHVAIDQELEAGRLTLVNLQDKRARLDRWVQRQDALPKTRPVVNRR